MSGPSKWSLCLRYPRLNSIRTSPIPHVLHSPPIPLTEQSMGSLLQLGTMMTTYLIVLLQFNMSSSDSHGYNITLQI